MKKLNLIVLTALTLALLAGMGITTYAASAPSNVMVGLGRPLAPAACTGSGWQTAASLPEPIEGAGGAVLNDRLYSLGGSTQIGELTTLNTFYSPISDTWTQAVPLPAGRNGAMAATDGTTIYVAGGLRGQSVLTEMIAYSPATDSWVAKAPMVLTDGHQFPTAQGAAVWLNGEFYLLGGYTLGASAVISTYIYSPISDTWRFGGRMPDGTSGEVAAVLNNSIYVVGGRRITTETNAVFIYTNTQWSRVADAPFPGELKYAGLSVYDGRLLVTGGWNPSVNTYYTSTYLYRPASNTWANGPNLNTAHSNHVQGTLGDRAVVAGGYSVSSTTATVEYLCLPGNVTATASSVPVTATSAPATATHTATSVPASPTPSVTPTPRETQIPIEPTVTPCASTISFSDVPSSYIFYNQIIFLACRGVISGFPNGNGTFRFEPNSNTKRGEFAKIVVNAFGIAAATPATPRFTDVPQGNVFYRFIEGAAASGAVNGLSAAQCQAIGATSPCFGPNVLISRAQVAVIVQRVRNYTVVTPATPTFSDVPASAFGYAAIETLASRNIINGAACGGGLCFRPNDNIRRGELSKVVALAVGQP